MEALFDQGIREFNEGRYFEAHDVLEDLWHGYLEPDRVFLQALIQAAVGFYHLENDNFKGARSQMQKACVKLEAFLPRYWDVRVDLLHASLKDHLAILEASGRAGDKSGKNPNRPRIQFSAGSLLTIS